MSVIRADFESRKIPGIYLGAPDGAECDDRAPLRGPFEAEIFQFQSASSSQPFASSAALLFALGYGPMPESANKIPCFGGWSDYYPGKVRFPDDIRELVALYPRARLGVVCGYNRLLSVDVDTNDQDKINAILHVLPAWTVAKRGSKGLTIFFRYTGDLERIGNRRFRLKGADGKEGDVFCEILWTGRKTTIPPTPHAKTGASYVWLNGEHTLLNTPIGKLPEITAAHLDALEAAIKPWTYQRPAPQRERSHFDPNKIAKSRYEAWYRAGLNNARSALSGAREGRPTMLFRSVCALGASVHHGLIPKMEFEAAFLDACDVNGLAAREGRHAILATIDSGLRLAIDDELPDLGDPNPRREKSKPNGHDAPQDAPISHDKREEFYCPAKDGEFTPVMEVLDKALITDEAMPPMRSLAGHPVEIELHEPAGFHELTAAGSNDDEAEDTRLPPPKSYGIARHTPHTMALTIERYARFYVVNKKKEVVYKRLPTSFVLHYLDHKKSRLPRVGGLMTMPLVLPNGKLLAEHGLNRQYKLAFCLEPEIVALLPTRHPTESQITEAMRFLTDDWLADVPTDYAGKCMLLALALSILERHVFGERPAFFVTAGKRGTGKTTSLNMIALAILGMRAAASAWSPHEEERRKSVFSALLQSIALIVWDNIKLGSGISCPTIEKTLTATELEDRVLSENRRERAPCTSIQAFTGNNIGPKGDLASRSLVIRLTTDRPDPENREYRHADPFGWTLDHRSEIIRSLYTILLGNPRFKQPLKERTKRKTQFKEWWHLVGAPIEHAASLVVKAGHKTEGMPKPEQIDFEKLFLASDTEDEETQNLADVLAAINRQKIRKSKTATEFMAADVAKWSIFAGDVSKYPSEAADAEMIGDYFAQSGRDKPSTKHIGRKLKEALDCPVLDADDKTILTLKVARPANMAGGITRWTIKATDKPQ